MTWIKICGLTNVEDALTAVEAGADAVGFVFYDKSPRNVQPERVREIVRELPAKSEKVGVFVNHSSVRLREIALSTGLTAIQHHVFDRRPLGANTNGSPSLPDGLKILISLSAACLLDLNAAEAAVVLERMFQSTPEGEGWSGTLLLDSGTPDRPGGTGKTFDWERAAPLARAIRDRGLKLILSGGLKPENVSDAIGLLHPWGVDVSSGVEAVPGKKDAAKIRAFIDSVRKVRSAV